MPVPAALAQTDPKSLLLNAAIEGVKSTSRRSAKARRMPERNVNGRPIKTRKGAPGIAGLRADLRDGRITVREISMLSAKDIAARYRVALSYVQRMRDCVLIYGGGSRCRNADGTPRETPL